MAIIGLSNVGKTSLFNAITKSETRAENYPFCTSAIAEGRVPVEDARFDWLVAHYKPASCVPAFQNLSVMDTPGLVKGIHFIFIFIDITQLDNR